MRIFNFNGFDIHHGVKVVGANGGFAYIFGDGDVELAIDRDITFAIGVLEYKGKNKSDILFGITWDNVNNPALNGEAWLSKKGQKSEHIQAELRFEKLATSTSQPKQEPFKGSALSVVILFKKEMAMAIIQRKLLKYFPIPLRPKGRSLLGGER